MRNQLLKMLDMGKGLIGQLLIQQRVLLLKLVDLGLSLSLGLTLLLIIEVVLSAT